MTFEEKPWLILSDPSRNKGTAFTDEERSHFKLHGRIPYHVSTLDEQVQRRYANFKAQTSDLAKHLFLSALHQRNEVLFYKLISEHISEMLPLIYTPTVGDYSIHFSYLYTEPRGLYLSYPHRDKMEEIFNSIEQNNIEVIVVTDGQRILGLGDLGTGGIAIPVGKLSLYTVFGGIHPSKTLPILLDVGTDNPLLLSDPLYLGWHHKRVTGSDYDNFVDQFVTVIRKKYPKVLLQWEDFGKDHARPLLEKYRKKICSFNDDIQGTAAVSLAALLSAVKLGHGELHEQRIVVFGGGSAGIGICEHLSGAMVAAGIPKEQALKTIYVVDIDGLVHTGLADIPPHQRPFARVLEEPTKSNISLLETVRLIHPTVLIGVSAQSGAFTQEVLTTMAKYTDRPIIFPLSNPTSKCEAHPSDILAWTKGKAIIATGSPFNDITYQGRMVHIAQCNNVYIYPGVGLGVVASGAKEVTEKMFYKAAEILSRHSPMLKSPLGNLFPPFENLRAISREIAIGVAQVAQDEGLAPKADPVKLVDKAMWTPTYS
ncbi:MAG: NAD-dependent malic enzyme [Rhabdochlamydiaceae bacterium]|nr:NAD-dependent malic enzyme [Rhabdochlamydiaceae bacterium]